MNNDKHVAGIERLARDAGPEQQDYRRSGVWLANGEDLARFAALVRADALEQAANLAESWSDYSTPKATGPRIARAIRAL